MRRIFKEDFKFRWDLLHLVNRAHIDAIKDVPKITEFLDFVQYHIQIWFGLHKHVLRQSSWLQETKIEIHN